MAVQSNPQLLGLPAQEFFSNFWQKAPAWGRQCLAFPQFDLTTDLLLELCSEDDGQGE